MLIETQPIQETINLISAFSKISIDSYAINAGFGRMPITCRISLGHLGQTNEFLFRKALTPCQASKVTANYNLSV